MSATYHVLNVPDDISDSSEKLLTRFGERVQAFLKNRYHPWFSLHSLENQSPIRTTDSTVKVLHTATMYDRTYLNNMQKFYIYGETKINNQISDQYTLQPTISSRSYYTMARTMTTVTLNQFNTPLVCVQCGPKPATYVNFILQNTKDFI
jgi:hypothetical protein